MRITGALRSVRQKWSHAPWAQVCGLFPILGSPVALPLRRESGNPRPSYAVTGGLRTHGKNGPHAPWGQARGLFPIPGVTQRATFAAWSGDAPAPPRSINRNNQPTKKHTIMAIAIPHKPRYRDRTLPIYYLVGDRMLLRRRPASVHDPRTPAQLRQRLRLRVASRFLKGFRPMVAEGFAPEELDNLRRVGAYQQALGRLMRGALVETPEGVAIDAARVLLSEGYGAPLGAVRARAAGGTLRLAWEEDLPKGCGTLLVGVWHRGLEQAQCHRLAVAPGARAASLPLPAGWGEGTLDVWVAPHGAGKRGRYDSAHCVAAPATTTAGSATRQTAPAPVSRFAVAGRLADLPPKRRRKPPVVRVRHRRLRVDIYSGPRRR